MDGPEEQRLAQEIAKQGGTLKRKRRRDLMHSGFAAGRPAETLLSNLVNEVRDAIDHMTANLYPEFERADKFYNGETDLATVAGRSKSTDTVLRDKIRSVTPHMLEKLTEAPLMAEFSDEVLNFQGTKSLTEQQSAYANQKFWAFNGYEALRDSVNAALLKKVGHFYAHEETYVDHSIQIIRGVDADDIDALSEQENVLVVDYEENEEGTYDVEVCSFITRDALCLKHLQPEEFFIDEDATSLRVGEHNVCGIQREISIIDAKNMGLPEDFDYFKLSSDDPEVHNAGAGSKERRGYHKTGSRQDTYSGDPDQKTFLLTVAYRRYDLLDAGFPQLYAFYLGGTEMKYITHEPKDAVPIFGVGGDPRPGTYWGNSFYDILWEEQNTHTSVLRATLDNAHSSNNSRLAVNQALVNPSDLLASAIGHPIRMDGPVDGNIRDVAVQSSIGNMLPLMQDLDMRADGKAGITNESLGLKSDTMQSTDPNAVMNTITKAEAQVNYMISNMVRGGIMDALRYILRWSINNLPSQQAVTLRGDTIPVNQQLFNPNLPMEPCIGTGCGNAAKRMAGLSMIYAEQKEVVAQMGVNNPIVPISKMINTLQDLLALHGITNISRYIETPSPEAVAQAEQTMQQNNSAPDPAAGLVEAEKIKTQKELLIKQADLKAQTQKEHNDRKLKFMDIITKDDLQRDKMAQDLAIKEAELTGQRIDAANLQANQDKDRQINALTSMTGPQNAEQ